MCRLGSIVWYETVMQMQGARKKLKLSSSHGLSHHQVALKCPRCDSFNTKFCYYNNYNLSQPRHFCKGCRRYWTNGGVLRNVPVGGGCRKANRCASSCKPKRSRAPPPASAPPLHFSSNDSSTSARFPPLSAFSLHEAPPLLPGYRVNANLGFFVNHVSPVPLPQQQTMLLGDESLVDGQSGNWIKTGDVDQSVFDLLPSIDTVDYWGETTITGYQNNIYLP